MIEFINLVKKLFPCIEPYVVAQCKDAISQFIDSGKRFECFDPQCFEFLAQGDIIADLPFREFLPSTGEEVLINAPGLLISNTCDAEQDKNIVFSPIFHLQELGIDENNTKRNLYNQLLYFPDERYPDHIVDLSFMNTFPKTQIIEALQSKKISKRASLNIMGYYLFLCKLTVHFMRPESVEVVRTVYSP